jgi:dTDP-4-dehydrorhamnose 3,5-epimerase-like enzyme
MPTSVHGVSLHRLSFNEDSRGKLTAAEFSKDIPFLPRRYFSVFDVPAGAVRGEHAHRRCQQFLVCARGSVTVRVDDGQASEDITLDRNDVGLYLPPLIWGVQLEYSADALLIVFASEPYDPQEYIRNYDEFKKMASAGR